MSRSDFEQIIRELSLEIARARLAEAQAKAATAVAIQRREELATEHTHRIYADLEKTTELPKFTVRTPTKEKIES